MKIKLFIIKTAESEDSYACERYITDQGNWEEVTEDEYEQLSLYIRGQNRYFDERLVIVREDTMPFEDRLKASKDFMLNKIKKEKEEQQKLDEEEAERKAKAAKKKQAKELKKLKELKAKYES